MVLLLAQDVVEFSWRYQLLAVITLPPAGILGISALLALRRGGAAPAPAVAPAPAAAASPAGTAAPPVNGAAPQTPRAAGSGGRGARPRRRLSRRMGRPTTGRPTTGRPTTGCPTTGHPVTGCSTTGQVTGGHRQAR